jgi:hypothetical protein
MSNELSNTEFFCAESFQEINGEGYSSGDIRTYRMAPLAKTPHADIVIHLSIPPMGHDGFSSLSTNRGNFLGIHFTSTEEKAKRSVFHFPVASNIKTKTSKGVGKIDSMQMPMLYPTWLISRYGRDNLPENLILRHETPLFLDKGTKEFLIFFDESFLDELDASQLTDGVDKNHIRVYRGKNGARYLALRTRDFTDFETAGPGTKNENPVSKALSVIGDNYFRLNLDANSLKKVIVIKSGQAVVNKNRPEAKDHESVIGTSGELSFGKAAMHGNYYYWIDDSGQIDTCVSNPVSRSHAYEDKLSRATWSCLMTGSIVIPYTDKDWDKLIFIKSQMDAIHGAFMDLVRGCEGAPGSLIDLSLDESAARISAGSILRLEDSADPDLVAD